MRPVARWCVTHRRVALAGWLVALVGLTVLSQSAGTAYNNSTSLKGTQSFEAQTLLERSAPTAAGDREQIVFAVDHGRVTDPVSGLARRRRWTGSLRCGMSHRSHLPTLRAGLSRSRHRGRWRLPT